MPIVYTKTLDEVPPTKVPAGILNPNGTNPQPVVAPALEIGDDSELFTKMRALAVMVEILSRYGGGGYGVKQGFELSDNGDGNIRVSAGTAGLDGEVVVEDDQTLAPLVGAESFVWLLQTGQVTKYADMTGVPAGAATFLGIVTTDGGGAFTAFDYSGRTEVRNGHLWLRTADAGVPTVNLPAGLLALLKTNADYLLWDGSGYWSHVDAQNVRVSGGDTTAAFLAAKLSNDDGSVDLAVLNPGANEQIRLRAPQAGKVKADGADTTFKWLIDALAAGAGISLALVDLGGGNLAVEITSSTGTGDGKVFITGADTVKQFLGAALAVNADQLALSVVNPGADETLLLDLQPHLDEPDPHEPYLLADGSRDLTGDLSFASHRATNLPDPASAQEPATLNVIRHRGLKDPAKACATANVALTGEQTIDGVSCVTGDRVLLTGQTTGSQNGLYVVDAGAWARTDDANTSAKVRGGLLVWVTSGAVNGARYWVLRTANPTLGTTALVIERLTAGDGATTWLTDTPALITGNENDYAVAVDATIIRLEASAAYNVTGISGGWDGRLLALVNVGTHDITLKEQDAGSAAGNRFAFGADLILTASSSRTVIWYDATLARWRNLTL